MVTHRGGLIKPSLLKLITEFYCGNIVGIYGIIESPFFLFCLQPISESK